MKREAVKKGQYFTIDVVVAGVVALLTLIMLVNYWHYSLENSTLYRDSLNKEAVRVSMLLFSKGGTFSIVNESSIAELKTSNSTELAKVIDKLNKSVYVDVHVFMDGALIYGSQGIGFPQAHITRLLYDAKEEKLHRIDIYVVKRS